MMYFKIHGRSYRRQFNIQHKHGCVADILRILYDRPTREYNTHLTQRGCTMYLYVCRLRLSREGMLSYINCNDTKSLFIQSYQNDHTICTDQTGVPRNIDI